MHKGRQQLDWCAEKLGCIGDIKQIGVLVATKFSDVLLLMLSGSIFHSVGAATEKARRPVFVLILGTGSKFQFNDRSRLCRLA